MASGSRIRRLIERQAAELDRLEAREARRFFEAYEDARRELHEVLDRMEVRGTDVATPFTAQRLRSTLAQLEGGIRRLQDRLGVALDASVRAAGEQAVQDLVAIVATQEPEFREAGPRIEHEALRRITEEQGLLLHRYSIQRYGADLVDRIQRELVVGVTRGLSIPELRDRIAGMRDSVLAGNRVRAELIVRMEMNSAFNRSHLTSIKAAGEELDRYHDEDDRLQKRADEFRDLRNHAISRALHGQVRDVDEPFRVPRAEVARANNLLNAERRAKKLPPKSITGIVWPLEGGDYVGMNYPAHYWDRGRIVPWRKSWEEDEQPQSRGKKPGDQTQPSMEPDEHRRPLGQWTPQEASDLRPSSDRYWEQPTAEAFARAGYRTTYLPRDPSSSERQPDIGVEDVIVEIAVPNAHSEKSLLHLVYKKCAQSAHVALNLDARQVWTVDEIREIVERRRGAQHLRKLLELWVVSGQKLRRIV